MSEYDRLRQRAHRLKEQYTAGTRVRLVSMDDVQAPPSGTFGTVVSVDDVGSVLVQWDTGSILSVTDADECVII